MSFLDAFLGFMERPVIENLQIISGEAYKPDPNTFTRCKKQEEVAQLFRFYWVNNDRLSAYNLLVEVLKTNQQEPFLRSVVLFCLGAKRYDEVIKFAKEIIAAHQYLECSLKEKNEILFMAHFLLAECYAAQAKGNEYLQELEICEQIETCDKYLTRLAEERASYIRRLKKVRKNTQEEHHHKEYYKYSRQEKDNQLDYYEILEVHPKASIEVIEKAKKALLMKYHPDRNPGKKEWAEKMTRLILEAYETLSDPEKRREYNKIHGY